MKIFSPEYPLFINLFLISAEDSSSEASVKQLMSRNIMKNKRNSRLENSFIAYKNSSTTNTRQETQTFHSYCSLLKQSLKFI